MHLKSGVSQNKSHSWAHGNEYTNLRNQIILKIGVDEDENRSKREMEEFVYYVLRSFYVARSVVVSVDFS